MDWQEDYKKKLMTVEQAVRIVKSGDRVAVGGSIDEPVALPEALFARRDELKGVRIIHLCPTSDYGWSQPGSEESFQVEVIGFMGPIARARANEGRVSLIPNGWTFSLRADERPEERKDYDVFMVKVGSPNRHGLCCFGSELWLKKDWAEKAKTVIAEVDNNVPWVYGDAHIHVSEIDAFVEHTADIITDEELPQLAAHIEPEEKRQRIIQYTKEREAWLRPRMFAIFQLLDVPAIDSLAETLGLIVPEHLEQDFKAIAGHLKLLMNHRDCVQIGQGSPSAFLPRFGSFEGKEDLGTHSELTARGVVTMIKEGQMTGKYKNIHRNRAVFNSFAGMSEEEVDYASDNPKVELYSARYVNDPRVIAMHDNMVAINNGISVDLTGQINAETVFGAMLLGGPGGQPDFHIGALLSNGGKAVTVMRSTVMGGTVSTIVSQFEPGTVVTVGRHYADYIVTEFGIAKLMNKNFRERAEELIAIAHPDFRAELKKEATRLFWPS